MARQISSAELPPSAPIAPLSALIRPHRRWGGQSRQLGLGGPLAVADSSAFFGCASRDRLHFRPTPFFFGHFRAPPSALPAQ
jgi:hypothetical protein